jgi:hypothetical protein
LVLVKHATDPDAITDYAADKVEGYLRITGSLVRDT